MSAWEKDWKIWKFFVRNGMWRDCGDMKTNPSPTGSIHIISLGCAKNLVDSEILSGGLQHASVPLVKDPQQADTIVINTCGFLDQAREESVDVILEAIEWKKQGRIQTLVVMGCLSERYPNQLKEELPEVDYFFGTTDHRDILTLLTGKDHSRADPVFYRSLLTPSHYAYVKIAEGCDNGCSFCSIPLMRGKQISRPVATVVDEVIRLQDQGVREFILIAQDTTSYGWDLPDRLYLNDLLDALGEAIMPQNWLRLHYAHPAHLSHAIIDAMARNPVLVPYLDMPVQHASDRMLKSMRRGLDRSGIQRRIDLLRSVIPQIRLRTTLIVGYPGETEDDFRQLYRFVEETEFDRLGVFTYSEEEGTFAADLPDDVPPEVKEERKAMILDLQNEIAYQKNQELIGQEIPVIVDRTSSSTAVGRTPYDSPEIDQIVRINSPQPVGIILPLRITEADSYELTGIPLES
ncbi:MAG: 30S ribosomal protein S12 methylthiotransferase RimO [Candidatus Neomarinimicrobiota bacterium]|nr:MAG: 30S ribosomal protein S12 methylthiotransferase RimO [Candidatus Neomarinimicrobiota bacterium]